ncbi:hypothetical protein C5D09_06905 [Rathayibacter sp. AY1C9]|uniref:hypothetical protein n=1 Tax=unclassified Rathayibacter TaxID=2609250 RepID=UPI000D48758F|nr:MULTISPECIES: hypothetical protein [unclassified Rathayibacter]PPH07142.1 hypothetical protein C5C71_15190 [Rathayibacter sp. AY1C1]PPH46674.1 hypothetical protein C5D09_06905 [Rathayibacter sp. AY1C9]
MWDVIALLLAVTGAALVAAGVVPLYRDSELHSEQLSEVALDKRARARGALVAAVVLFSAAAVALLAGTA